MKSSFSMLLALGVFLSLFYNNCAKTGQWEDASHSSKEASIEKRIDQSESGFLKVILRYKSSHQNSQQKMNSETVKQSVIELLETSLKEKSAKLSRTSLYTNYKVLPVIATEIDKETLKQLQESNLLEHIEEDIVLNAFMNESNELTQATRTQELGITGKGKAVAVIDTGVQVDHPGLGGRVVGGACYASDCDSEGLIGGGGTEMCSGTSECKHGTHVAGIIAGNHANLKGVAPEANIYSVRVFKADSSNTSLSYVLSAMEDVLLNKAKHDIVAINLSLGNGKYSRVEDCRSSSFSSVVERLNLMGVTVFAASGNDSHNNAVGLPACVPGVIRVGSSTKSDTISSFSNQANWLRMVAPGSDIYSFHNQSGFATASGTSMATPNAAGAFVALKARFPAKSNEEVLAALHYSSEFLNDSRIGVKQARYDLYWALRALSAGLGSYVYDDSEPESSGFIKVDWKDTEEKASVKAIGGAFHLVQVGKKLKLTLNSVPEGVYSLRLHHPVQMNEAKLKISGAGDNEVWLDIGEKHTDILEFSHDGFSSLLELESLTGAWHLDKIEFVRMDENQISLERANLVTGFNIKKLELRQPMYNGKGLIRAFPSQEDSNFEYHWYKDGQFLSSSTGPVLTLEDSFGNTAGNYHVELRGPSSFFNEKSEAVEVIPVNTNTKSSIQFTLNSEKLGKVLAYYQGNLIYEKEILFAKEIHNINLEQKIDNWEDLSIKVVSDASN